MNDSLITHLMPITYFGGTGGHLVRSLLIASKVNYQPNWKLSPYGHAHKGPTENYNRSFMVPGDLRMSIVTVLSLIKNSKFDYNKDEVYYHQFHLVDVNELMKYFYKSIRICYAYHNIEEVSLAMLGKYAIGERNIKNSKDQKMIRKYFLERKVDAIKYYSQFQHVDNPNVLNLDWELLVRGDPDNLFERLSSFTGLKIFSLNNLLRWRELTLNGINEVSPLVK
jgi:hypothetical protein